MTTRDPLSGLQAARVAHGWSQAEAARELAALARSRGTPVAAPASLKTLLSRWENGHTLPDPHYRALLADLYGRSAAALGLSGPDGTGDDTGDGLVASLAAAASVHRGGGIRLWQQQLELARELDDELGAAGAGELVHAMVEHVAETLLHTVPRTGRVAVAELLAGAAVLAGTQALDRTEHERAWRRFDQARQAAIEADLPAAAAAAAGGQAAVLVDVGDPGAAVQLLEQTAPVPDGSAQARLDAGMAMARAAAGEPQASRRAMAAAEQRLGRSPTDLVDRRGRRPVELVDLHRWQGRVLVTLGDTGAEAPLQRALAEGPRSTRQRAAVHADLALALHVDRPEEAEAHARTARRLAAGIGSERIVARLAELGGRR
jgi:transcriptional regulator with XRE-family HTH domain